MILYRTSQQLKNKKLKKTKKNKNKREISGIWERILAALLVFRIVTRKSCLTGLSSLLKQGSSCLKENKKRHIQVWAHNSLAQETTTSSHILRKLLLHQKLQRNSKVAVPIYWSIQMVLNWSIQKVSLSLLTKISLNSW